MKLLTVFCAFLVTSAFAAERPTVAILPVPGGGIQPQVAVDQDEVVHLVYFKGSPTHGDIFYVRSRNEGATFSQPVRVNSQAGSAVAAGTIRGAQLAVGQRGRVHVVWNGSTKAVLRGPLNPEMAQDNPHNGLPLLYSRTNDSGDGFEPARNLMTRTFGLDGGAAVAADKDGRVYVGWHASSESALKGEAGRRVWIARSVDEGQSFSAEQPAFDQPTGACACCGMALHLDSGGNLYSLYRSARELVHRDVYLLFSETGDKPFRGRRLHEWEIGACPVSSMVLVPYESGLMAAWETESQVYFASIAGGSLDSSDPKRPSGEARQRKHPRIARDRYGQTLLVWAEVPGWGQQGTLAWQTFDTDGTSVLRGVSKVSLSAWSFGAAFPRSQGGFVVVQ